MSRQAPAPYANQDERDAALDARYTYQLEPHVSPLAGVDRNRETLGQDFLRERDGGMWSGTLEDGLSAFLRSNLGHVEPAVLGLLLHEVGQYVLDERGRPLRRQGRPPVDWRRWEDATARVGRKSSDEPSFDYVVRICRAAGVQLGRGPRPMPEAPHFEDSRAWYDPQEARA